MWTAFDVANVGGDRTTDLHGGGGVRGHVVAALFEVIEDVRRWSCICRNSVSQLLGDDRTQLKIRVQELMDLEIILVDEHLQSGQDNDGRGEKAGRCRLRRSLTCWVRGFEGVGRVFKGLREMLEKAFGDLLGRLASTC